MLKHIKVLNIFLVIFVFSLPANLHSTPGIVKALTKWVGLNREKKEYTDEFKRCTARWADYFIDQDIKQEAFSTSEVYLSSVDDRAHKACEARIPEEHRFKKKQED